MNNKFIEYDKKIKLILVGDSNVGKTTFFNKLRDDDYLTLTTTTIGVDFMSMRKKYNNEEFKICLWDTAGQERYKSVITTYFREICGVILMFDLSRYESYINLQNWLNILEYANKCNHNHPILLIGNKSDLKNIIPNEELEKFKQTKNVIYIEMSCINTNRQSLENLLDLLINKISEIPHDCKGIVKYNKEQRTYLQKHNTAKKNNCC